MSLPRSHVPTRAALRLATPLALLLLGTTACGGDTARSSAPSTSASPSVSSTASSSPSSSESATSPSTDPATATATAEPTQDATPSSPTASPEDDDEPTVTPAPAGTGPAGPPTSDLLAAGELPPLDPGARWTTQGTLPVGTDPFGVCQRFDALTLGARDGVERRFAATGASAAQQVLDFPDAQNASRAAQVLATWHRDCQGRLPGGSGRVGPRTAVPVASGSAWWYLATWEQSGTGRVQTFGLALNDDRLTLLHMDHEGRDHDYPAGTDPLARGVAAAAAKMDG